MAGHVFHYSDADDPENSPLFRATRRLLSELNGSRVAGDISSSEVDLLKKEAADGDTPHVADAIGSREDGDLANLSD